MTETRFGKSLCLVLGTYQTVGYTKGIPPLRPTMHSNLRAAVGWPLESHLLLRFLGGPDAVRSGSIRSEDMPDPKPVHFGDEPDLSADFFQRHVVCDRNLP